MSFASLWKRDINYITYICQLYICQITCLFQFDFMYCDRDRCLSQLTSEWDTIYMYTPVFHMFNYSYMFQFDHICYRRDRSFTAHVRRQTTLYYIYMSIIHMSNYVYMFQFDYTYCDRDRCPSQPTLEVRYQVYYIYVHQLYMIYMIHTWHLSFIANFRSEISAGLLLPHPPSFKLYIYMHAYIYIYVSHCRS